MKTRGMALALTCALLMGASPCVALADEADATPIEAYSNPEIVKRLWGENRYRTMFKIVDEGFESSEWAIITSGENFPDALAASALAGARKCPVIITETDRLTPEAAEELERLKVSKAYIVGGEVSERVAADISKSGIQLSRVVGRDRVATSLAVMEEVRTAGTASNAVIITTGADYADALSIGPWAYATATPIVLANADGTLGSRATDLIKSTPEIGRVIIVGGTKSVSDEVKTALGGAYTYQRLEGADRYETSARVAEFTCSEGLSWKRVGMASGKTYPDALCGSALMGSDGGPLLLVSAVSDVTTQLMLSHRAEATGRYILGGLSSVSAAYDDPALYSGAVTPVDPIIIDDTKPDTIPGVEETLEQALAKESAQYYFSSYSPSLSRDQLIETLTIAGFSDDLAAYGADSIGATWPTEAPKTVNPDPNAVLPYVINAKNANGDEGNRHIFHLPMCSFKPNEGNREIEFTTYKDLRLRGYDRCGHCLKNMED